MINTDRIPAAAGTLLLIALAITVAIAASTGSIAAQESTNGSANLEVELEQSATVSQNGSVDVTAYVNNLGDAAAADTEVELLVDADGDGQFASDEVVTTNVTTVDAGEYLPVTLTYEDVGLAAGDYQYIARTTVNGETTDSFTEGTLTVEAADDGASGGDGAGGGDDSTQNDTSDNQTGTSEPSLALDPQSTSTTVNGTSMLDVNFQNADGGVGAFDAITVTVDDTDVATITDVSSNVSTNPDTSVSADRSEASVTVPFGGDTADQGDVTLLTVELEGQDEGSTDVSVNATGDVADESGMLYGINGTADGSVSVAATPAVVGDTPAADRDGDGKAEDLNGNNETDIGDVQALFNSRDSPEVTQNADLFDYNGNGAVDIGDIQQLFNDAQE
ncbi:hypothetical protein [Halopenitus sp. POP-27]|uniref:hypothetical protein n=1 Tax=Halopenitus sp. POP-27 TaxID=2994425 RepID=UPI002468D547|nr:hypothetical protein [Halopenitus sp. POP-27]